MTPFSTHLCNYQQEMLFILFSAFLFYSAITGFVIVYTIAVWVADGPNLV